MEQIMHVSDGKNVMLIPVKVVNDLADHPAVKDVPLWKKHILIATTWKAAQEECGVVFLEPPEEEVCGYRIGRSNHCSLPMNHKTRFHMVKGDG